MKKKIIAGILAIVLAGGGFFVYKKKNSNADTMAKNTLGELNSYHLEGNMEMMMNDELKTYKVDVDYLKKDSDLFRVCIYDKTLNQSQTIIKNTDGVFVYTPTLNQIYKFKSEWPFNSDKPYIYQTLLSYFDKENQLEKTKDGVILRSAVTYPHDEKIVSQEIKFDKNMVPQYISLYDDQEAEHVKVEFTKFNLNEAVDESLFNIEQVSDSPTASFDNQDFPLLPLELLGSQLVSQEECSINGTTTHILQFNGDKSFTIVESVEETAATPQIIETSAELVDLVNTIAMYENQELKYLYPGMVCSVYSDNMSKAEMIEVVNSLQNEVLK